MRKLWRLDDRRKRQNLSPSFSLFTFCKTGFDFDGSQKPKETPESPFGQALAMQFIVRTLEMNFFEQPVEDPETFTDLKDVDLNVELLFYYQHSDGDTMIVGCSRSKFCNYVSRSTRHVETYPVDEISVIFDYETEIIREYPGFVRSDDTGNESYHFLTEEMRDIALSLVN